MKPRSTSVPTSRTAHAVADVQALSPRTTRPSTGGRNDAHPGPLRGSARDDAVEALADPRRRAAAPPPTSRTCRSTFGRVVFLLRAVARQLRELLERCTAQGAPASAALTSRCVTRSG